MARPVSLADLQSNMLGDSINILISCDLCCNPVVLKKKLKPLAHYFYFSVRENPRLGQIGYLKIPY